MIRSFPLAACAAAALAAVPGLVRAATGPQHVESGPACVATVQQPHQQEEEKEHWRERFSDWLRRHALRDPAERGTYYFRSPLLSAFGPRTHHDCSREAEQDAGEKIVLVQVPEGCAAIVVNTHTDARMFMELPLPQLGAHDPDALVTAVNESLARGQSVRVYDHDGNPLTLDPEITRGVQSETCG